MVEVLDGDKGWVSRDGMTQNMDEELLAQVREQLYTDEVTRLMPLDNKAFKLALLGEKKVAGRDAVGVRVEHKGRHPLSLYFDKANGLLLKSEARVRSEVRAARLGSATARSTRRRSTKITGRSTACRWPQTRVLRDGQPFLAGRGHRCSGGREAAGGHVCQAVTGPTGRERAGAVRAFRRRMPLSAFAFGLLPFPCALVRWQARSRTGPVHFRKHVA